MEHSFRNADDPENRIDWKWQRMVLNWTLYSRLIAASYLVFFLVGCDNTSSAEQPDPEPMAKTVTVSIDASVRHQTIQGFGGFGAKRVWWAQEPFYDQAFVDLLIEDLGITILRDNIPIAFEPENDNDDPYHLDLNQFNTSADFPGADSHMGQHLPYLRAMHEAGLEKLIASIWSPPIWMKHNDHRGNGTDSETSAPEYTSAPDSNTNQLRLSMYDEFAEYCVAYIQLLQQEAGIDLYALSLQNEPRFSQFYASTVHSFESLRDLIKVVGKRFEEEGIDTKIFMPEDVQSIWHIRQYLDAILNDPEANRYVDVFAIHNYRDNGVDPSDEGPQNWQETYQKAQAGNKEVWMTETSGFDGTSINGGLELAKSMYNAMHFGNASVWVYWQMSDGGDNPLIRNGTEKTYLYFVSKQFYRHIRPGSVRIDARETEPGLLTLAFEHVDSNKMVVLLINTGDDPLDTRLTGMPSGTLFTVHMTSFSRLHYTEDTPVDGQGDMVLPGKSIATLVAEL